MSGEEETLEEDPKEVPEELKEAFPDVEEVLPVPFCVGLLASIKRLKEELVAEKSSVSSWKTNKLECSADFADNLNVQRICNCVRDTSRTTTWQQVGCGSYI